MSWPKRGYAGFNAQPFNGLPTASLTANLVHRIFEPSPEGGQRRGGHEAIEPREAGAQMTGNVEIAALGVLVAHDAIRGGWQGAGWKYGEEGIGRLRSFQVQEPILRRHIRHLDVISDDVLIQPRADGWAVAGFEVEQDLVGQAISIEIALDAAFGIHQGGITTLALAQPGHIIGHLPVQKGAAIGAKQTKPAAAAQIENNGGPAKSGIFTGWIAVMFDNRKVIDGEELRAVFLVDGLEAQRVQSS
jgi:hypothetical protein